MADLDVVTEDLVEADFEGADPRAPSLCRLEPPDPVTCAARGIRDGVEVWVVTGPDHSAFAHVRRRILDQSPSESSRQLRGATDLRAKLSGHQGRAGAQGVLHGRDRFERAP